MLQNRERCSFDLQFSHSKLKDSPKTKSTPLTRPRIHSSVYIHTNAINDAHSALVWSAAATRKPKNPPSTKLLSPPARMICTTTKTFENSSETGLHPTLQTRSDRRYYRTSPAPTAAISPRISAGRVGSAAAASSGGAASASAEGWRPSIRRRHQAGGSRGRCP